MRGQHAENESRHVSSGRSSKRPQGDGSITGLGLERLTAEAERIRELGGLAAAEAKLSFIGLRRLVAGALLVAALAFVAWGLAMAGLAIWLQSAGLVIEAVLACLAVIHGLAVIVIGLHLRRVSRSIGFQEVKRRMGYKS